MSSGNVFFIQAVVLSFVERGVDKRWLLEGDRKKQCFVCLAKVRPDLFLSQSFALFNCLKFLDRSLIKGHRLSFDLCMVST